MTNSVVPKAKAAKKSARSGSGIERVCSAGAIPGKVETGFPSEIATN
jgi:hypothetical protein